VTARQFLQSAGDSRNSARELLQLVFASELVAPSRCVWLVSPWIRDVPVLDNTTGGFVSLCPEFPRGEVRLSSVLKELMRRGTQIVVATRPEQGNRQIVDALADSTDRLHLLRVSERPELHAKGIVGDRYALTGSMNLTYNGLEHLTEMLLFQVDRGRVEELRILFRDEYGGLA
jgi:phosphatidylserine/phosphatidylglycerophosphate/cardiolipin synthase-like enzyme